MRSFFLIILIVSANNAFSQTLGRKCVSLKSGKPTVSLLVPTSWNHSAKSGIDSDVGYFTSSVGDTLNYDLGAYSNSLRDPQFHESERIDYKTQTRWSRIGKFKWKIVSFSYKGRSEFGAYLSDIFGAGKDRTTKRFATLVIYGRNVSATGQKELLRTLESLRVVQ